MTDFKKFKQSVSGKEKYELYFFESLLEKYPDFTDVLFPLADLYTALGLFEKGLELDLKLSVMYPDDESVWYNLSCSFSLCGKIDDALDALEKAIKIGWDDAEHIINDHDLDNIKHTLRYNILLNYLINKKRA